MPNINIDHLTTIPLYIESVKQGITDRIGATGFIVEKDHNYYLITNWHIMTGRNPINDNPISGNVIDPEKLIIFHHSSSQLGKWIAKEERLLDEKTGEKRWIEHPSGRNIDVIALPITVHPDIQICNLDLSTINTDLIIPPSEAVSIVGFPKAHSSAGRLPIWKTGHVASDIDIDYGNKPVFLIDATTKDGMSGSPVLARKRGAFQTSRGYTISGGEKIRFLGVYSGRIKNIGIGMVWKSYLINDILP